MISQTEENPQINIKIIYRNQWFGLISISAMFIALLFLIFNSYDTLFDYEKFRLTIPIFFFMIANAVTPYFQAKIELNENSIRINKWNRVEFGYHNIHGIAKGINSTIIVTKSGKRFPINHSIIKNKEEIETFLFKEKNLPKLPFYQSINLSEILGVIYLLLTFLLIGLTFTGKSNVFKEYLPLKKVEVVEIEGRLSNPMTISQLKRTKVELQLEHYGVMLFRYAKERNGLPEIPIILLNENESIAAESKVSIQIRSSDFEKIKKGSPIEKNHITFYALKIDGRFKLKKEHLKLVQPEVLN